MAVTARSRRRRDGAHKPRTISDSTVDAEDQPRLPSIVVGLYLGILAAAKAQGLYVILLLTEPRRATRTDGTKVGSKARRTGARAEHRRTPIPSMMKSDLVAACLKSLLEAVA